MPEENPKELGCIVEALLVGMVYVTIFAVIKLVFGVRIGGLIPMMAAVGIVGWFITRRYRKNLEKRLGRKVRGKHELTSLSSWMEASARDEEPRVTHHEGQKPQS